ncbi:4Fe-4S dicluster domain-containing protein [bacterium]|nr:4Fe-4S dicluster domain-containing protein [bacterium]
MNPTLPPDAPDTTAPLSSTGQQQAAVRDLLTSCVHCGLCLEVCPTYQLSGDENNSPRGRLRLWREEAEGRLAADAWTAQYTEECVGCLACESACPANVPYGEILEQTRHAHVHGHRSQVPLSLRMIAQLVRCPRLFQAALLPARWLRSLGWWRHRQVFPGQPAVLESTANYARRLMTIHRPTGPRVALLTGCLMEALFREINFATVRVLIENNVQVIVPDDQGCCGAFQEHLGLDGIEAMRERNRTAFSANEVEAVVCNSSGCGLALSKGMTGQIPIRDVTSFLGELNLVTRLRSTNETRVYVDLPCHLVHGQKQPGIPDRVLDATGYRWELAPMARDCCGSGGTYHLQKPETSRDMLARKSAFLNTAAGDPVILATSNHVCLMQWHSAGHAGLVTRPYQVRHVIQLLDPGEDFTIRRSSATV